MSSSYSQAVNAQAVRKAYALRQQKPFQYGQGPDTDETDPEVEVINDDDEDMEERKESYAGLPQRVPRAQAASQQPTKSVQVPSQDKEMIQFLSPSLNTFKSLLAKASQLNANLASARKSQSIPKAMQLADRSMQIPANQPLVRNAVKEIKEQTERRIHTLLCTSLEAEQTRVLKDIKGIREVVSLEIQNYFSQINEDILPQGISSSDNTLQRVYMAYFDNQCQAIARIHTAKVIKDRALNVKREATRDAKAEEIRLNPEQNIQQLVNAAVAKATNRNDTPKTKKPNQGKQQSKNGKSPKGNKPPLTQKKQKPRNNSAKGKGSGSQKDTKKKSNAGRDKRSKKPKDK